MKTEPNVTFIKSKVANIVAGENDNPMLKGVNTEGYHRYATEHDLVVLAVGMEPNVKAGELPIEIHGDANGFIRPSEDNGGIFAAGVASEALDVNRAVQNATGSALRAIQVINRISGTEG